MGNTKSPMFPKELLPFTNRTKGKDGQIKSKLISKLWMALGI